MKAAFLLTLTFALLWAGGYNAPPAQERLQSRAGEARVAIFQDNLDQLSMLTNLIISGDD